MVEGDRCCFYKVEFDGTRYYGSTEHSISLCRVQGEKRHCLDPVAPFGSGQCSLHENAIAPIDIMFYAGLKRPYSLRGPSSSSEAVFSKFSSSGG